MKTEENETNSDRPNRQSNISLYFLKLSGCNLLFIHFDTRAYISEVSAAQCVCVVFLCGREYDGISHKRDGFGYETSKAIY